jgi:FAD/FMN-containing dehydrogenase
MREAEAQFVKAAGGKPSTDLLILDPSSPRFTGLARGFNRRWSAPRCNQILLPLTEAGAMEALDRAIDSGPGKFRIRGGGHCYEDFVFNGEAQTLIDVSLLNEIGYDAENGVYYAQSGGTLWDLYRQLYWRFGLTLPAGSCYSVGLGGHICGGGYGTLSRQFGLTVDWLSGVRVATVDQNERPLFNHATKEDSPPLRDLWWSHTGGGGGNFGLITRYEFSRLPIAPLETQISTNTWSWSAINSVGDLAKIIEGFEKLNGVIPNTAFAVLGLSHRAAGQIGLAVEFTYDDPAESLHFAAQVRALFARCGLGDSDPAKAPICAQPSSIPYQNFHWFEAIQTGNSSGPNRKGKQKSAYMRKGFSQDQIKTIYKYLTMDVPNSLDMSQSLLQVDSYGGRINAIDSHSTAVWQRSSILKLQYQTYWNDQNDGPSANGDAHIDWIRRFYAEMYAASGGIPDPSRDPSENFDGCYINYPDVDLNNYGGLAKALSLYYGSNLPRLMQVKRIWDPHNYFQNNQSIPLA